MAENSDNNAYWAANIRLVTICLVIWALASYGFGILLRPLISGIAGGRHRSGLLVCPAGIDPRLPCPDLLLRMAYEQARQEHGVDE
jgi:hypothetical protein